MYTMCVYTCVSCHMYTGIYLGSTLSTRAFSSQTTGPEKTTQHPLHGTNWRPPADQNTRMQRRAWLFNRLPFDARLVQSLNVKHTSIRMANTFPSRSLFYSYQHPALRTLLLRTASHCCGRWVRASKQAIQLKAWVWPEAGWNQYTEPPLHFGRHKHRTILFVSTRRQSQKISMFFFKKLRGAPPMSRPGCSLGPTIGENQDLVGPELTVVACFGHSRAMD